MPTEVHLKKRQRGQTLILSFLVTSNNSTEKVTSDEINVNDLTWVRFSFSFTLRDDYELDSTITFKRHEKAKSAGVKINVSCNEFKKECICPDGLDCILEMKIDPKKRDAFINSVIVASLEVTIIARDTTRPSLINKLFEDTEYTDFQLCASDGGIAVHKSILPLYSDMFKTMLRGEWKETTEGRINVAGANVQTLQHLKEYMYLDTLPDDGLEPLLLLAAHYLMDTLKADCITKLVDMVKPENVHGLIKFACENNLPDLIKAVLLETPETIINGFYNLEQSKEE